MEKNKERNYLKDNETAKKAIQKEEEFLKEDVIGKGAEADGHLVQNDHTEIEKTLEK